VSENETINNELKELINKDTPAWYRQEGEGDAPYEYFDVYRKLPLSKRSVTAAQKIAGNKSNNRFFEYSKKYNWEERARAWDNYVVAKHDEFIVKQKNEIKLEHLQESRALRKALSIPLRSFAKKINVNGDNFDGKSLTELWKMIIKTPNNLRIIQQIEFTALGEASEIKKEDITSNGNTIKISFTDE